MSRFLADLRSIKGVTPELEAALIDNFEYYWPAPRRDSSHVAERQRQRDAVEELQRAAHQLHKALRRAEKAFAGHPPIERLDAPLAQMTRQLEAWSGRHRGRRGRPLDIHRQWLRFGVFDALIRHGIPPNRSPRSRAAHVLLVVFEEADRRDGVPPPAHDGLPIPVRASYRFSSKKWIDWLAEYDTDLAWRYGSPSREK